MLAAANQFLVWVWSFMGLWVGFALANIAQEELVQGRTYFVVLERSLFVLGMIPAAYLLVQTQSWIILSLVLLASIFLFFANFNFDEFARYGLLFAGLFLAINNALFFILTGAAIFLYGLPAGTLSYMKKYFY